MEILSYVLSGALSHKDSEGNVGVIRNGDVQRMSAGTGIVHSEFNASEKESVHFLQIWIVPAHKGIAPRYEDRHFPIEKRKNRLCLIASPDEAEGSLSIDQDARVYATVLDAGKEVELKVAVGRGIWVQVARGEVMVGHGFMALANNQAKGSSQVGDGSQIEGGSKGLVGMECAGEWVSLKAGDGAALEGEHKIVIRAEELAEFLVFDLA